MKRNLILCLIAAILLATPSTASAAGKKTPTTEEVKERAAEAQAKGKKVVVKLRAGTKILIGEKALPFEFTKDASLSGRVKEVRENDFTLSDTKDGKDEVTTVISYANVVSIKRPNAFVKTLKAIGEYSLLGVAGVAILPLYAIVALLNGGPTC